MHCWRWNRASNTYVWSTSGRCQTFSDSKGQRKQCLGHSVQKALYFPTKHQQIYEFHHKQKQHEWHVVLYTLDNTVPISKNCSDSWSYSCKECKKHGGGPQIDLLHKVPTFDWRSTHFFLVPMLPTGNDDHLDQNWKSNSPSEKVLQYDPNCSNPSRSKPNCCGWKNGCIQWWSCSIANCQLILRIFHCCPFRLCSFPDFEFCCIRPPVQIIFFVWAAKIHFDFSFSQAATDVSSNDWKRMLTMGASFMTFPEDLSTIRLEDSSTIRPELNALGVLSLSCSWQISTFSLTEK